MALLFRQAALYRQKIDLFFEIHFYLRIFIDALKTISEMHLKKKEVVSREKKNLYYFIS